MAELPVIFFKKTENNRASLERNLFFTYSFVAAGNFLNSFLFIKGSALTPTNGTGTGLLIENKSEKENVMVKTRYKRNHNIFED